jgi:hypothetical protein
MNFTDVLRHPFILLWRSKTNPHEIGTSFVDRLDIGSVFLLRERAEWRRAVSGNDQAWKALLEAHNQILHDARASSIEKVPVEALGRPFAHRQKQIRAADATRIRIAGSLAPPNKRHPVLCREAGPVESTAHLRISLRLYQAVNRRTTDILPTPIIAPFFQCLDGLSEVYRGDAHPKNVHPWSRVSLDPSRLAAFALIRFHDIYPLPTNSGWSCWGTSRPA